MRHEDLRIFLIFRPALEVFYHFRFTPFALATYISVGLENTFST